MTDKPILIQVTDPTEIAAIQNGCSPTARIIDPIGMCVNGVWWALKWSIERWRAESKEEAARG